MKFSARSEYALRAMIDLATNVRRGVVGVREIAARQGIPERFLEQQMTTLKKAGLINSQRGAAGGVSLARIRSRWPKSSRRSRGALLPLRA